MSEKIGIRPCVILVEHGKVLCVKYSSKNDFYLFPGGGIEKGETIAEAAVREMKEESGIKVKLGKIVYINDWIENKETNSRVVNIFFTGQRVGGKEDNGVKDNGKVKGIEWIDLEEFKNIDFRPKSIAERLFSDYKNNFKDTIYIN